MPLPDAFRVQYHVYLTSEELDATYILSSSRLKHNMTDEAAEIYIEQRVQAVIHSLNEQAGVSDFRPMTGEEVECFVRGMHKHNLMDPGEQDVNTGLRH